MTGPPSAPESRTSCITGIVPRPVGSSLGFHRRSKALTPPLPRSRRRELPIGCEVRRHGDRAESMESRPVARGHTRALAKCLEASRFLNCHHQGFVSHPSSPFRCAASNRSYRHFRPPSGDNATRFLRWPAALTELRTSTCGSGSSEKRPADHRPARRLLLPSLAMMLLNGSQPEYRAHDIRCPSVLLFHEGRVYAERQCRVGVTKASSNSADVHTGANQLRCSEVPQVMEANVHSKPAGHPPESLSETVRLHRHAPERIKAG